jgi:hypothetical protein
MCAGLVVVFTERFEIPLEVRARPERRLVQKLSTDFSARCGGK